MDANKIKEIAGLWEATTLLKGLEGVDKTNMALWFENQRLFNETLKVEGDIFHENITTKFKRLSIPLISRMYRGLASRKFVSIHPMYAPCSELQIWEDGQIQNHQIAAKTRDSKAQFCNFQNYKNCTNLDAEAELTAILAMELTLESDREILADLKNNSPVTHFNIRNPDYPTLKDAYTLLDKTVEEAGEKILARTGVPGKLWVVSSPEVIAIWENCYDFEIKNNDVFSNSLGISERGKYKGVTFYSDPLFPMNTIIVGLKADDERISGYYYAPYYLIPTFLGETVKISNRYGKYLTKDGSNFYQRINIQNFGI